MYRAAVAEGKQLARSHFFLTLKKPQQPQFLVQVAVIDIQFFFLFSIAFA